MNKPTMDLNLLDSVMRVQSHTHNEKLMRKAITRIATKVPNTAITRDEFGNLYITKGIAEVYPTVIAHMDTVHKLIPPTDFQIIKSKSWWAGYDLGQMKPSGIGGDDKVGIFIALSLLKVVDNIKLAFFVAEEIGCYGSRRADMTFFDNSAFVIECDRKGYEDVVSAIGGTDLFGDEFRTAITPLMAKYEKKEYKWGGLTDVAELKEKGLKVATTNLSCGYHRPHSADEYISLAQVKLTLGFVYEIVQQFGHRQWLHTYTPKATYSSAWSEGVYNGWADGLSDDYNWYGEKKSYGAENAQPTTRKYKQYYPYVTINKVVYDSTCNCPLCETPTLVYSYPLKDYYCATCKAQLQESTLYAQEAEDYAAELDELSRRTDEINNNVTRILALPEVTAI